MNKQEIKVALEKIWMLVEDDKYSEAFEMSSRLDDTLMDLADKSDKEQ